MPAHPPEGVRGVSLPTVAHRYAGRYKLRIVNHRHRGKRAGSSQGFLARPGEPFARLQCSLSGHGEPTRIDTLWISARRAVRRAEVMHAMRRHVAAMDARR
jgi:hypothetical protein